MKSSCKIFIVMSIFVGMLPFLSFAQKGKEIKPMDTTVIRSENLPVEVSKSFKKRFATATDVVWRSVNGNFVATCVMRNIPTEAVFQKDGTWLSTTEDLDPSTLPAVCAKSVASYFKKYMLTSYKRKTESNKDITFIVGVYEEQNVKKKLETFILLDKAGIIIRTIEPVESVETTDSETGTSSDKKKSKQEAKEQKDLDKDSRMDSRPVKISENELPPALLRWIALRYPGYVYKEILYTEDPDFEEEGNLYRVKIQRSGLAQYAGATVWFTRDGEFLFVDDPFRTEEELKEAEQKSLAAEAAKEAKEKEEPKTSKGNNDAKTEKAKTSQPFLFDIEDVPEEYRIAMKQKYPRVKEAKWTEDDLGDWIAFYTDPSGNNEVFFEKTDSVRWLETKTPVSDLNRVPFGARSYVEKNYPKQVSIKQAWSVKSAKVKPYFIVELYNKKDKLTEILEFWQTGKIKE